MISLLILGHPVYYNKKYFRLLQSNVYSSRIVLYPPKTALSLSHSIDIEYISLYAYVILSSVPHPC